MWFKKCSESVNKHADICGHMEVDHEGDRCLRCDEAEDADRARFWYFPSYFEEYMRRKAHRYDPWWVALPTSLLGTIVVWTLRGLWQAWPGLLACSLFWVVALPINALNVYRLRSRLYAVASFGALLNAVATVANGGFMPALIGEQKSLWIPISAETNLVFLTDIIPTGLGHASVGDAFIIGGLLVMLARWAFSKLTKRAVLAPKRGVGGWA